MVVHQGGQAQKTRTVAVTLPELPLVNKEMEALSIRLKGPWTSKQFLGFAAAGAMFLYAFIAAVTLALQLREQNSPIELFVATLNFAVNFMIFWSATSDKLHFMRVAYITNVVLIALLMSCLVNATTYYFAVAFDFNGEKSNAGHLVFFLGLTVMVQLILTFELRNALIDQQLEDELDAMTICVHDLPTFMEDTKAAYLKNLYPMFCGDNYAVLFPSPP